MKIISIIFSLILLSSTSLVYADYRLDGSWFCNSERPEFEKADYKKSITSWNDITSRYFESHPGMNMAEKGNYLIYDGLQRVGQKAACLKEVHGIEPDSVAMFSPEIQEVFKNNMDKLIETAPALVKYATVPEFGSIVMLIMIISIIAVIVSTRKFQTIK